MYLKLSIAFKIAYICCFTLGENLEFLSKSFLTLNTFTAIYSNIWPNLKIETLLLNA